MLPHYTTYKYTKDHEWLHIHGDGTASIGITPYAIEQLGDVVYLELPKIGDFLKNHETFGTVESTKTVSDLFSPVSGTVLEVNEALTRHLDDFVLSPYEGGWLVKIQISGDIPDDLLTYEAYQAYIAH